MVLYSHSFFSSSQTGLYYQGTLKRTDENGTITYKPTFHLIDGYDVAPDGSLEFYSIIDQSKRNFKTNLKSIEVSAIFYGYSLNPEFNGGFLHEIDFTALKRIIPLAIVSKPKTSPTKTKMMAPAHLRGSPAGGGRASVSDV